MAQSVHNITRMQPLYEAMSICSSALEWLEQKEHEDSYSALQVNLAKLSGAMTAFLERTSSGEVLKDFPDEAITGFGFCVETLNAMTLLLIRGTREMIPGAPEAFKKPIEVLLQQVEELSDKVDNVLDSWTISLDHRLVEILRSRAGQIDKTKTDIPDWREALELISD
jgi:hypothetical protein